MHEFLCNNDWYCTAKFLMGGQAHFTVYERFPVTWQFAVHSIAFAWCFLSLPGNFVKTPDLGFTIFLLHLSKFPAWSEIQANRMQPVIYSEFKQSLKLFCMQKTGNIASLMCDGNHCLFPAIIASWLKADL